MELHETVPLMLSTDYKERLQAEYYQLKIRHNRLQEYVDILDKANSTNSYIRVSYQIQLDSMFTYLRLLEERANIEGIELKEV